MIGHEYFLGDLLGCTTTYNVYPVNINPNKSRLNIVETARKIGFPEAILLSHLSTHSDLGNEIAKMLYAKVAGKLPNKENIDQKFVAITDYSSLNRDRFFVMPMTIKDFFNYCVNIIAYEKIHTLEIENINPRDITENLTTAFEHVVYEVLGKDYPTPKERK